MPSAWPGSTGPPTSDETFLAGREFRPLYNAHVTTSDENWVVVFAKRPVPGEVKTRLVGLLGRQDACDLYQALLTDTLAAAGAVRDARGVIACTPCRESAWFGSTFGEGFECVEQGQGDLGDRMSRCFDEAFSRGARRVVVIGSDLPTLSRERIEEALAALDGHDLVLGPALDGGYYLIGLRRPAPELFSDVDWSTERVLRQTVEHARRCGLTLKQLAGECDVDDESSLRALVRELDGASERIAPHTREFLKKLDGRLRMKEMA